MIKTLCIVSLLAFPFVALSQAETENVVVKPKLQSTVAYEEIALNLDDSTYCSCIETARALGVKIPLQTNAIDLIPNDIFPHVGGLVLLRYGDELKNYHGAVVIKVEELGMWIIEGNFKACQLTKRFILFTDDALLGYWYVE